MATKKALQPIALNGAEMDILLPHVQRVAAANRIIQEEQRQLDELARAIIGRAGGELGQRYALDLPNKRLVPLQKPPK